MTHTTDKGYAMNTTATLSIDEINFRDGILRMPVKQAVVTPQDYPDDWIKEDGTLEDFDRVGLVRLLKSRGYSAVEAGDIAAVRAFQHVVNSLDFDELAKKAKARINA